MPRKSKRAAQTRAVTLGRPICGATSRPALGPQIPSSSRITSNEDHDLLRAIEASRMSARAVFLEEEELMRVTDLSKQTHNNEMAEDEALRIALALSLESVPAFSCGNLLPSDMSMTVGDCLESKSMELLAEAAQHEAMAAALQQKCCKPTCGSLDSVAELPRAAEHLGSQFVEETVQAAAESSIGMSSCPAQYHLAFLDDTVDFDAENDAAVVDRVADDLDNWWLGGDGEDDVDSWCGKSNSSVWEPDESEWLIVSD